MFMAGSLIILSQPQADSHNHSVCLCMSPAAFLSLLKRQAEREREREREREVKRKKNKKMAVEQTSGAAWAACRAELGDRIRTGHTGRRHTER